MIKKFETKDSGERREFSTGARRDVNDDKPDYTLISPFALKRLAMLMVRGRIKYGKSNWTLGMPYSVFAESAMRHFQQFLSNESPEEDHLAAVLFNIMAIMHFQETGRDKELDDLQKWNK